MTDNNLDSNAASSRSLRIRTLLWSPRPLALLLGSIVIAGLLSWLMLNESGLLDGIPNEADSIADWLVTKAFTEGVDPYLPVPELGRVLGVPWESANPDAIPSHPRLPGAFILQLPMLLADSTVASWGVVIAGCVGILFSLLLIARGETLPAIAGVAYLAMALVSGAALWGFAFVSQAVLLVGILAVVIWRPSDPSLAWLRGIAIAIAGTLRVFPLLLLFAFARRRDWKTVSWAVATIALLNLPPLAADHVALDRGIEAFSTSLDTWFGVFSNISLLSWLDRSVDLEMAAILPLQILILGIGALAIVLLRPTLESELGALSVLGVMGFSVSWPQYLLAVLPFLLVVTIQQETTWLWRVFGVVLVLPFTRLLPTPSWGFALLGLFLLFAGGGSLRKLVGSDLVAKQSEPTVDRTP